MTECKYCKYYECEGIGNGYVCTNIESDYCADWVDENFSCIDFEERED